MIERGGEFKYVDPKDDLEALKCGSGRFVNVVIREAKQWSCFQNPGTSHTSRLGKALTSRMKLLEVMMHWP